MPDTAGAPATAPVVVPPAPCRFWIWTLLVLALVVTACIRFRLRDMPLERDEGEYAYAGQLLLQGIPPYQLAYNMKFPGTYIAYAAIMKVFGETPAGIHLGFLLVNAANTIMVFLLAGRFTNRPGALAAAALYSYLALSVGVLGTSAHATHFVILATLPGLLLLLSGIDRGSALRLFLSGGCLGAAVLMKQHGAVFVAFAAGYLAYSCARPLDWSRLSRLGAALGAGVLTSLGLNCLWLWRAGVFGRFWFWTIQYGRAYAEERPSLFEVARKLAHGTPEALYPVTYIALCGLGLLALRKSRSATVFTAGLLAVSVLAIFPNFNFRPHYYVLTLPVLCVLTGVALASGSELLVNRGQGRAAGMLVTLFVGGLLWAGYHEREVFFLRTPEAACRWAYGQSPFPEAIPIAEYLKAHTARDAKLAVLGSEPEIYFYADRHSATGYIYTYALMEDQPYALRMQKEMISEVESARPEYVVYIHDIDSWVVRTNSETLFLNWCAPYLQSHYDRVGFAEIFPDGQSIIRWGSEAENRKPATDVSLTVYRRKEPVRGPS